MAASVVDRVKLVGLVLVLVPVGFILLFAAGESMSGGFEGLLNLLPALPFLLLAWAAWRWPGVGGAALLGLGLALSVLYLVWAQESLPLSAIIATEAILIVPTVIAGVLFLLASRMEAGAGGGAGQAARRGERTRTGAAR